ncbi:hypothetical protein BDZ90DRAFT_170466 [Jaminaea rosea]|uniref:Uncharacterized protein n=1 Tax=Jaminaea rosea TaxID=1569628 RepID=A0A316UR16_9BASI|nr:hypothetical protein BDZ90DRAFT_170466 [Jaminaea rosea]PWN27726.1 hypothetical protein BDZ90DRAFT_170466 [Jaminaea rosea]
MQRRLAARFYLAASISIAATTASAAATSTRHLLRREADLSDAQVQRLGTTSVPQGPIVLVLGGLGVALVALIFVVIKVLGSGKASSSSRQIMAERAKAKTDLRVRGIAQQPVSRPTPTRGAGTSDTTAVSTPFTSPTASRHFFEDYSRRNSHINALGSNPKEMYSPSLSKRDNMDSTYNSMSSMVDVPMLMAQGRTITTFSQDSSSSAEGSKPRVYNDMVGRVGGPRRPQTQPRPNNNRTSVYRGTDIGVSRKGSTRSHHGGVGDSVGARPGSMSGAPAWMDASRGARAAVYDPKSPMSDLKRHNTDSGEHSRRNSSSNLLDQEDVFATPALHVPTPLFAATSQSSASGSGSASSSDHSSALQPVSNHPLSKRTAGAASADGHGHAAYDRGHQQHYFDAQQQRKPPPRWAQTAAATQQYNQPQQQQAPAWQERPRPNFIPAYPGAGSNGLQRDPSPTKYFDVEQNGATYETARPGQFHQQVAPGNGRRGVRGFPAGTAASYSDNNPYGRPQAMYRSRS